jgi:hypothetical protein
LQIGLFGRSVAFLFVVLKRATVLAGRQFGRDFSRADLLSLACGR